MNPYRMPAEIPMPEEVGILAAALRHPDEVEVFVVGGAVRDYLFWKFHGDQQKPYLPKDVDLTTSLSEEEILERLRSSKARSLGIRVKEKESVDTFGVVFASVNGGGPFEIAPYRRDVGSADGRRPERIERGTIYEDAMRRDLTINNLYYDFERKEILDFNGEDDNGISDIYRTRVRTVGDPVARFEEDKLRVLRLVRFFCRLNDQLILSGITEETAAAIEKFRNLRDFKGITSERIQTEFMLGLKQARNKAVYLQNYELLGLLETVFPKLDVDLAHVFVLKDVKSDNVTLAWILWANEDVGRKLNELKYPNEISEAVQFLVDAMQFEPEKAVSIVKARDRKLIRTGKKKLSLSDDEHLQNEICRWRIRSELIQLGNRFGRIGNSDLCSRLFHLAFYEPEIVDGEQLMEEGFEGKEIGIEQNRRLQSHYEASFANFGNLF